MPRPTGCSRRLIKRLIIAVLVAVAPLGALADSHPTDPVGLSPEVLWEKIRSTRLEPERAVEVRSLVLNTGMALFKIDHGILFPTTPVGERTVEMVFLGSARLVLEPPDDIEAGQLELFTDSPAIEEQVEEAVLVVNLDAAADAIARRPPVENLNDENRRRAEEIFQQWRRRPERRLFGVESAIFRDAFGDPLYEGYFAGWFHGEELEEMLYLVDPNAPEQVTLGRFTTLDTSQKEERKLARLLHRQQRKGRLIGVSVEDDGLWDTWFSSSHRGPDGEARPGAQAFEPRHYELDLVLAEPRFELQGRARIHLTALSNLTRIVKLNIHSDLEVRRASVEAGADLFFHQTAAGSLQRVDEVLVILEQTPQRDEELILEIEYSGHLIDKVASKSYALRDTIDWYPHAGTADLATYDVTLHWPEKLDLIAGGRLVDSGTDSAGRRFERRRLDRPTRAFGFEVGKFHMLTGRAGNVAVTLACDASGSRLLDKKSREELLATLIDAIEFFEATFGPYPLNEVTAVTVQRPFSQSLLGFLTLSSVAMSEESWVTLLLGFEDRRTVVAHEVAHQWWGHIVSWQSYRDQWISEAMANYAAMLYARHRLAAPPRIGPTRGWQREMTRTVKDGRPVESIGPLVLGGRLASSISFSAYQSIVYKKGAVVLEMLAHAYGEQAFLEILRRLIQAVSFSQVSTQFFVDLIEGISNHDLENFAQQFIYGTGLPRVYYSYTFEPGDEDPWLIKLAARQQPPYRYNYRVEPREDGALDVTRQRLDQTEIDNSTLYVPFQVTVFKPDVKQSRTEKKLGLDPKVSGNARVTGRLELTGASTERTIPVAHEPKELWLDPQGEIFARFFNERRHPKRMLYYQAHSEAAASRHPEAEQLFRQALAAEVFAGPSYSTAPRSKDLETEGQWLDAWIRVDLARLHLDSGRASDAQATFEQLRQHTNKSTRQRLGYALRNLEARLAIQQGDNEAAYKLLRKPVLKRGARGDTEGLLLLALAARAAGHTEDYETALEAATEKGAEVAALIGS